MATQAREKDRGLQRKGKRQRNGQGPSFNNFVLTSGFPRETFDFLNKLSEEQTTKSVRMDFSMFAIVSIFLNIIFSFLFP